MSSEVKEKRFCKIAQPHSYVRFRGIGERPNKQKTSDSAKAEIRRFFVCVYTQTLLAAKLLSSISYNTKETLFAKQKRKKQKIQAGHHSTACSSFIKLFPANFVKPIEISRALCYDNIE